MLSAMSSMNQFLTVLLSLSHDFRLVNENRYNSNSQAVYVGGFHRSNENLWKIKIRVKSQSEADTGRMWAEEFCFVH